MSIKSLDLIDGVPVRAPKHSTALAGVLMLAFGVPLWILGAKYSLDGWAIGLNILGDALTLPARLPMARDWWALLCVPLGLCYSYVEIWVRPRRSMAFTAGLAIVVLMLLTHITDVGSTYLAITTPSATAWALHAWAAREAWPAALWALFLTYTPEVLILGGVRMFK